MNQSNFSTTRKARAAWTTAVYRMTTIALAGVASAHAGGRIDELQVSDQTIARGSVPTVTSQNIYDLKAQWSDASNPNAVWSYNEGLNPLPHVDAWQRNGGGWGVNQPGWARSEDGSNRLPFWYKSNGSENFGPDIQAGDIVIHSWDTTNGVGNGQGNVTWTSPTAGSITISGSVWSARNIGRTNHWSLTRNGNLLSGADISAANSSRAAPFNFTAGSGGAAVLANIPVAPGDVIKLQVERTSFFGDFVGVNFTVTGPQGCTAPPAGMVGWWTGDGSGRDIQGGRSGTPQGDVTFVPGKVAQAFRLDGLGDRILVGNPPSLQLQDFTIDTWIKRASATLVTNDPVGNPGAVFFAYGNLGYGFGIDQSTSRLFLTHVGVSGSFSVATVTDTNYHHVAVTKQGGTVTFYVDGVADAPVTYNPTFTFTTGAAIGARGDNDLRNAFFGDIDELEIFNRALAPSEISAVFNAGATGKCKPPQPANAFSRKMHGANGSFDIDLMPNAIAGVECRTGGASGVYQMVVQFPGAVSMVNASILSGTGSVSGFMNNTGTVTIDLTNVGNAQTLIAKLNGVTDGTLFGDVPIAMSVLLGDSNGDAVVNSGDATQVRTRSGQSAAPANFRSDVNADGTINSGDALIARSRSGNFIP